MKPIFTSLLSFVAFLCFAQEQLIHTERLGDSLQVNYYVVTQGLTLPWEMVAGPDGRLWITHDYGTISRVDTESGAVFDLLQLPDIANNGSIDRSRMVGLAMDTDFEDHPFVYVCYNYYGEPYSPPRDFRLYLKVVRYRYDREARQLLEPFVLLDNVSIHDGYHVGGKMEMDANRKLFITVGDAKQPENPELHPYWQPGHLPLPQDLDVFSGKILRINPDGSVPEDNPFAAAPFEKTARNLIYSYGHRNPQGLAFGPGGTLYYTEHGGTLEDELGMVKSGGNCGWPYAEGMCNGMASLTDETVFCDTADHQAPIFSWHPDVAPGSLAFLPDGIGGFFQNSLLVPTLTSEGDGLDLRMLRLSEQGNEVLEEVILADDVFGRLRDICVSADGSVYFTTSNTMWGVPQAGDERIIRMEISRPEILNAGIREESPIEVRQLGLSGQMSVYVRTNTIDRVSIYSMDGRKVLQQRVHAGDNIIVLQKGVYVLRVPDGPGAFSDKILVR